MRYLSAIAFAAIMSLPATCFALIPSPPGLSDAEQSYYDMVFAYTMEAIKPGDKYDWASYGGKGSIAVGPVYVSKAGATCRNFSEDFNVQGQAAGDAGVGCKRVGQDGWCKLKADDAPTCALEQPQSAFEAAMHNAGNAGSTMPSVNMNSGGDGGGGFNVNAPATPRVNTNVNTGNTGNTDAKSVSSAITSNMGSAAGSAAGGAIHWFSQTFGR